MGDDADRTDAARVRRENSSLDHLISELVGALCLSPNDLFAAARRLPPELRAVIAGEV
jgi:hypothetical protein